MMGSAGETWVKMALAACISCMLTGAAAWFTFGQNKVTRPEMIEYVADQAKLVIESAKITDLRLDTTEASNTELRGLVKDLTTQQSSLTVELRSFVAEMRAQKQ